MRNDKKWSLLLLCLCAATLLLAACATFVIDPFFHYHRPLDALQYPIDNERYQNNGIVRHFDYDAILTGTSMTENFRASEFDSLFGVRSVKTPFNGSTPREIANHLDRALAVNPDVRLVLQGIDGWNLLDPPDLLRNESLYPTYLYDTSPFNDVNYLLNKQILLDNTAGVLKYTLKGNTTTSFDAYANWNDSATFGKATVLGNYSRQDKAPVPTPLSQDDRDNVLQVVQSNVIRLAEAHPDTEFYYFFTPYSIVYWDILNQYGTVQQQTDAYRVATAAMLEVENIRLFDFFTDFSLITDLDQYYDPAHYHEGINSLILQRMAAGEYELTKENCEEHWDAVEAFYLSYDYESIFR